MQWLSNNELDRKRTEAVVAYLEGNQISPITCPRSPEGSRKLRFPDYVTMAQNGGKVVSTGYLEVILHNLLIATEEKNGKNLKYGYASLNDGDTF